MSGHTLDRPVIAPPVLAPPVIAKPMVTSVPRDTGAALHPPIASRRRFLLLAGVLLVVCAGSFVGQRWWTVGRFIESTDDAYVGGDVTVLAPKVAGIIRTVAVTDNQAVHAGDLLVALDDRDYQAAIAKAEAGVAAQRATLANVAAARRLQEAMVEQARADLGSTEAEIARSQFDADRYRQLSRDQYASVQRFQQADADRKKAQAADAGARATLEAAIRRLDVIDTQTQQAQAALQGAFADVDTARLNLEYTQIRAPVDGTIGNRSARVGAYATPGTQLLSLIPADGLWVDANFKESQLRQVRPGMAAEIEADALPGTVLHGHVQSMSPASGAVFSVLPAENATGNFTKIVQRVPVRIHLDGTDARLGRLRPGLSVTASVDARTGAAVP
jgi:membrane fusion protein (multidrug efflux system)